MADIKFERRREFDLGLMLARLSQERTVNTDGSINMAGFGALNKYESFFRTAVFAQGKTDAFVHSVVHRALATRQILTEGTFVKDCNRIANDCIKNELKKFKVVFPLWGTDGLLSGRRKWRNVSIAFGINPTSAFFKRAKRERAAQMREQGRISPDLTKGHDTLPLAVCSVSAINVADAFEQAENAITIELGLFSATSSRGQFLVNNGTDKPIGQVLLAPHMTVHDENGAMSSDVFWYNNWPAGMIKRKLPEDRIEKINRAVNSIRKRVRRLPWRSDAESALARHYLAYAQSDLEAAFLDGWRLLEAIGGHPREKGEKLVKRAAWFFHNS